MGLELQKRGMDAIASHVQGASQDDYLILVFNGLEQSRTEMVEVSVDILASDNPGEIGIIGPDGEHTPYTLVKECEVNKSVFSPINLPGCLPVNRYTIRMVAKDVPAYGYKAYRVIPNVQCDTPIQNQVKVLQLEAGCCIENKYLKVMIHQAGQIDLICKENGVTYEDLLGLQDTADTGDVYMSYGMPGDVPIDIKDYTPQITVEEADLLYAKICLHYELALPCEYDRDKQMRSETKVRVPIDISLDIDSESRALNVKFSIDNKAKDHRVRARINTKIKSNVTMVSAPFDIIDRDKTGIDTRICNETEHNSGMVTISENGHGISVLNRGIYGYENLQAEEGTLAFTILRSTSEIAGYLETGDGAWSAPENQCLHTVECELAILPQVGEDLAVKAGFASKVFQNKMLTHSAAVDVKKFSGGRPAVQDTNIAELFYREIPYKEVKMELVDEGILIDNHALQVTAFKKAYNRQGYILRFFNMKDSCEEAVLDFAKMTVSKVWKTNLAETDREEIQMQDGKVSLTVRGKEIVTLLLQ